MNRKKARDIILDITERLSPFCIKIEPVGSWRRGKEELHDIDFICLESSTRKIFGQPKEQLRYQIERLGDCLSSGGKSIRIIYRDEQIDFYITRDTKAYSVLKLIRTGSAEFNRKLCGIAKKKGMKLKADGGGLINPETKLQIAWDEEEILKKLLGHVPKPEERE